jgi:hypothetical protein
MGHTRVKTTYAIEGAYASSETHTLYCHHSHVADIVTFHDKDGGLTQMVFQEWETGNDLWDAVNRLWFPYKGEWGGELKDGVSYYSEIGD